MQEFLKELAVALNYSQELLLFTLILARISAMVIQAPFLGAKATPPEVKMGLGVVFSIVLWPVARGALTEPLPTSAIPYLLLMLKEIFVGFVIGFVSSHIFTIVETAGRLIDTARGSSMSEVLVPESGQRATPFGDLYYQLLVVIFMAMGAHSVFFDAFFFSFGTIPVGKSIPLEGLLPLGDYMIRLTGDVLVASVLLSAPVLAAVLITDVVFGILNRVAPQLNAYFMAMPVKAMGGVALTLLVLDTFASRLGEYVIWSLSTIEKTIALMSR